MDIIERPLLGLDALSADGLTATVVEEMVIREQYLRT